MLERFSRHGVRFIDQQYDAPALAVDLDQVLLQGAQQLIGSLLIAGRALEIIEDRLQNLLTRKRRIGQIDGFHSRGQSLDQHAAQHGLAGADLASHLDDALVMCDGVEQRLEGGTAIGPRKEEIGMRRDAKRRLTEAEMIKVHGVRLSVQFFERVHA